MAFQPTWPVVNIFHFGININIYSIFIISSNFSIVFCVQNAIDLVEIGICVKA